jgi:uncharacterized protein (TIGR02001 family)
MKSRLVSCLLVLSALCSALRAEEPALWATTNLGFESAYVSYGTKFSENTLMPKLDFGRGDLYAGVWGYLPIDKGGGGYVFDGEWDFFGGRTLKLNDVFSLDLGGTLYQYPGVTTDEFTFEGFLGLTANVPFKPTAKLFYDFTIENWIGELAFSHEAALVNKVALVSSARVGFRRPLRSDPWLYATLQLDLSYPLGERGKLLIGPRLTHNSDNDAVGHGVETWWGVAAVRSW